MSNAVEPRGTFMTQTLERLGFAWRGLERWLFDPIPTHAIVVCRIGLGSVLFLAYLSCWPLVEVLYGPSGYAGFEFRQRFPENADVGWSLDGRVDLLQQMTTSEPVWVAYLALLTSALLFAMGVRPKLFGTLTLLLHVLFLDRNPGATWGWATMIKPFLLYTILASTPSQWSLTGWWQDLRGNPRPPTRWTCSAWPQRLLQIHVTCVFLVLWSRFDEPSWLSGQTLAFALVNRDFGRFDVDWYPYFESLEIASIGALVLECGAPIALWIKPLRPYWALALIGMFATLVVTTSVGWWDFMMIFVLTTFLPAEWLERLFGQRGSATGPTRSSQGG